MSGTVLEQAKDRMTLTERKSSRMSRRWNRRIGWAAAVAMLSHVGCQSLADGAKSDFATAYACPANRVEVKARPDLHPSDFKPKRKPKTPPADVAADPERLKMWQAEQDRFMSYDDTYHSMYEANGCGHQALYECGHATRGSSTSWICWERTYPRASATAAPSPSLPSIVPTLVGQRRPGADR
jgi:hypothetical protein